MDQRSMAVLNKLTKADSYISVEKLAELFNVSRRTIYNDLDKINDWLKEQHLSQPKQVRGKGLYLEPSVKRELLQTMDTSDLPYYAFSKTERKAWIYIYLVGTHQFYFLDNFQDLFGVSRNTVIEDIKKLKKELETNQLRLVSERKKGYNIHGTETVIRSLLIQYLTEVVPKDTWFSFVKDLEEKNHKNENEDFRNDIIFSTADLYQVKAFLNDYERQVEIEITDDVRNDLILWFYLFIQRVKQGKYVEVDPAEKEVIHTTDEFQGAKELCRRLSNYFHSTISLDEIYYFTKYLLSAKVNYSLNLQLENQEMKKLTSVVEKMVYDFQTYAAVAFPDQQRMIHNLLLHLKPTYYRIKYGLHIENVLKDSVKNNYPEIFHLTKKVIHHVEDLMGQKVDDNEIAFITMHFGGWLRKEGVVLEQRHKKLLIVCTNGLGTSRLLESQLEGLFSDVDITGVTSLREYEEIEDLAASADFIVSTIVLPDRGVPVFVVDPVLNNEDKEQLLKKVNSLFDNGSYQNMISIDTVMDMIRRYAAIQDEATLQHELKTYFQSPISMDSENQKPDLPELLPKNRMKVKKRVETWKEAISEAAYPLLNQGLITSDYVKKMIQMVEATGPYIVISDQVALPHANPKDGVIRTGMSMLLLENDVNLRGKSVRLFIVLASIDNEQHLKALSQLTQLFSKKSAKEKIMQSGDQTELIELIQTHFKA
ncbi:transcriptional antiterminator, BglG family [Lentibacillus halodurans]|uniref:Transcriptional antiterminator, BglG family n=1 Tax=Lentibacillus halodurans TaxID=237679 RepID=A0A1I0XG21_9BACI|nr:BglG family transcription antiterminator [Lentibacillus halodurans]SFA99985.1 transcriptional antiterminator, BglG family [Lentibacillus halodurans]